MNSRLRGGRKIKMNLRLTREKNKTGEKIKISREKIKLGKKCTQDH